MRSDRYDEEVTISALRRSLLKARPNPNSGYNSESCRRRKSESMKLSHSNPDSGFNRPGFTNFPSKFYYESERFGSFNLDSGSELYCINLVESIESVSELHRCTDIIEYFDKDNSHHYYKPDFKIITNSGSFIVEVKSEYYLKNELNPYKFKYARDFCNSCGLTFLVFIRGVNESDVIDSIVNGC